MRDIQISDHFDYSTMLLFSLPTIGTLIVNSTYVVADGFFISNYIGAEAFAAENLIYPPIGFMIGMGFMFGTGASAVISRELGSGRPDRACGILSMLFLAFALLAVLLAALVYPEVPAIAAWVGAPENLIPLCTAYGEILVTFMPILILTVALQLLLITAERPGLGFATTAVQAVVNILLTWAFVAELGWGLEGAALGTVISWVCSSVIPLTYFCNPKNTLHFARPIHQLRLLGETVYNGASEMVDATSVAIVSVIFNLQLMRYLGEAGVAAYAVGDYVLGLFLAMLDGICISIVPVVGYHFGAGNHGELRSLRRKGLLLVGGIGILMAGASAGLAQIIAGIFLGYDESLKELATEALRFLSLSYLFLGITLFSSSYFTGMGQGTLSLVISLCESLIGPLVMVHILPPLLGRKGLWLAEPAAQCLTVAIVVTGCFLWWKRKSDFAKES